MKILIWILFFNFFQQKVYYDLMKFARDTWDSDDYTKFRCNKLFERKGRSYSSRRGRGSDYDKIMVDNHTLKNIRKNVRKYRHKCVVDKDDNRSLAIYIYIKLSSQQKEFLLCQNCKNPKVSFKGRYSEFK